MQCLYCNTDSPVSICDECREDIGQTLGLRQGHLQMPRSLDEAYEQGRKVGLEEGRYLLEATKRGLFINQAGDRDAFADLLRVNRERAEAMATKRERERLLKETDNLQWQGHNQHNQVLVSLGDVRRMLGAGQ